MKYDINNGKILCKLIEDCIKFNLVCTNALCIPLLEASMYVFDIILNDKFSLFSYFYQPRITDENMFEFKLLIVSLLNMHNLFEVCMRKDQNYAGSCVLCFA